MAADDWAEVDTALEKIGVAIAEPDVATKTLWMVSPIGQGKTLWSSEELARAFRRAQMLAGQQENLAAALADQAVQREWIAFLSFETDGPPNGTTHETTMQGSPASKWWLEADRRVQALQLLQKRVIGDSNRIRTFRDRIRLLKAGGGDDFDWGGEIIAVEVDTGKTWEGD